jgi:hypothetical protein
VTNIDTELERCSGNQCLQFTALELLLGIQPLLTGEAAVMRGHLRFAEPLGERTGYPFRQPARVDEDQSRAVLLNQCSEAIVDLLPHFA